MDGSEHRASSADRLVAVAVAGTTLMAVATWWVGGLPIRRGVPSVPRAFAYAGYYAGLTALVAAWLVLGRRILAGSPEFAPRVVQRLTVLAAGPLLFAAPLGRDLWAYAAQGHLTGRGLDPYTSSPADVPGRFSVEVSSRWMHSSAPYGPLWLRISQFAAWVSRDHPLVAALLLRLPALAGLLLCCWAVPVLAERLAGRAPLGLWLMGSPLMVVLGVGGGHNDLLMLGLALAGLAVASGPGLRALAIGAAITGVAVMIKSPAAVATAFTVPVWLAAGDAASPRRRVVGACATGAAGSAAAIGLITAVTGLGFGWVSQVNSDARWVSWLSLPSAAAMLGKAVSGAGGIRDVDTTLRACRTVGEVLAVVCLVGLWSLAVRRATGNLDPAPKRRWVVALLAAAWAVAALLSPSVQPWYYLWALAVAGLVAQQRRLLVVLAAAAVMFAVMIMPSGHGWESDVRGVLVIVGSLGLAATVLRRPLVISSVDR